MAQAVIPLRQLEENRRQLPDGILPKNPEKDPRRFGKIPVDPSALQRRLGPVTWRVWWHCERTCSPVTGAYFMGRAKAAAQLGISENAFRKALARLYAAGLVQEDHRRKTNSGSWLVVRAVAGHWADGPGKKAVLVPMETFRWLNRPEKRGGKRPGAGRPRANSNGGRADPLQESNGGRANSNGGPPIQPAVTPPAGCSYGTTSPAEPATPVVASSNGEFVQPATGVTEAATEVGGVLRGKVTSGGRPPPPGHGGVPRFPGPTVMPPATVPGPPMLPSGLDDAAAVDWLLKAYRGAVEARTKKRCWVLARKGEAQKSKHWPVLVKAARQLEEFEWRPGAWVMWRLDSWAEMHGTKKEPPLHWVFSVSAMEEHGGWFQHESGAYSAPRVVYNAFAQDVLRRYQAMQLQLLARGAVGEAAVREVVMKHWPGDSYRQAVARANARTQEDQMLINTRIARGDWVWG